MGTRRAVRLGCFLLEEISELMVRAVKDPRIAGVSLTRVRVSKDLRHARVFFSVIGEESRQAEALQGLQSSKVFSNRELARHLHLRYMPEIDFSFDDSFVYADRIDKLLKGLHESVH